MTAGLPYFKCYQADFLSGILGLEPEEIAVYTVVLMQIYDRGGAVPDDRKSLAWRCRLSGKKLNAALDRLIEIGKLTLIDGRLSNPRAEDEIEKLREKSEKNSQNISKRWNDRRASEKEKPSKNNDPPIRPNGGGITDEIPTRSQKLEARSSVASEVVKPTKADLDRTEAALREAAGLKEDPSPGLFNLAPILGLIDAGYRLDEDVLPAIRAVAASGRKGRVWSYYVPAVTDAAKARTQAGASPAPAPQKPAETPESTWRMKFNAYRDHDYWPAGWGPPPGRYGCPMPQELIDLWTQEKTA
jgi:uncharacterized protein YdaU (DUF1376 family)